MALICRESGGYDKKGERLSPPARVLCRFLFDMEQLPQDTTQEFRTLHNNDLHRKLLLCRISASQQRDAGKYQRGGGKNEDKPCGEQKRNQQSRSECGKTATSITPFPSHNTHPLCALPRLYYQHIPAVRIGAKKNSGMTRCFTSVMIYFPGFFVLVPVHTRHNNFRSVLPRFRRVATPPSPHNPARVHGNNR